MTESVIELSRFRVQLSRSLSRRGKSLLESDNIGERVAELTPLEGYFVVKELGSDTALPILSAFSDEQFQTLIDIDGWRGSEPQLEDIDAWLAVYRSLGHDDLANAFLKLDPEVQTLLLRGMLEVWDPKLDAIPEPAKDARRKDTPDGFFHIEAKVGKEWEVDPFDLVDVLYRFDIGEGTRQLLAARTEQDTFLSEEAYRFRNGRLEDWGFPARERAIRIFSPPDPKEPEVRRMAPDVFSAMPALYAAPMTEGSLLVRALNRASDDVLVQSIQQEMVFLVNTAIVAYGGVVRDLDHVIHIAERVRDGINLGLELLTIDSIDGERAEDAFKILNRRSLEHVFRTGHFELEKVARWARTLAEDPVLSRWLSREDTDDDDYKQEKADRAFFRTLTLHPPLLAGFDRIHPERAKLPATLDAITEMQERLDALVNTIG